MNAFIMNQGMKDMLGDISVLFGIIASLWAAGLIIQRFYKLQIKPFLTKLYKVLNDWPVFVQSHANLELQVQDIKHQVYPNNGGSIIDKLNMLYAGQAVIKEKQRAMMYNDSTPMFAVDAEENLVFVNEAWLQLTGFNNPQDAYNIGWLSAIPEEDRNKMLTERENQKQSPSNFYDTVRYKNRRTGEIVSTICRVTLVRDEHGKLIEKIGSLQILKPL